MQQVHPIPPVFDADSTVLVLGSFPSVKSRESGFFYGHAQNRFWRVTAAVFDCPVPVTIPEKRAFLLQNHVALWDVIASCDIDGSSDASIKTCVRTISRRSLQRRRSRAFSPTVQPPTRFTRAGNSPRPAFPPCVCPRPAPPMLRGRWIG